MQYRIHSIRFCIVVATTTTTTSIVRANHMVCSLFSQRVALLTFFFLFILCINLFVFIFCSFLCSGCQWFSFDQIAKMMVWWFLGFLWDCLCLPSNLFEYYIQWICKYDYVYTLSVPLKRIQWILHWTLTNYVKELCICHR